MHRLRMGGFPIFCDAVPVMHFHRTIQAQSDSKTLGRKKAAPVLIEEDSVGLNTVSDVPVIGLMFTLERNNFAEVVQTQDGRFPAMPGKTDDRFGGGFDVLDNDLLQDEVGHAKRLAFRIEVFLLQVITIFTVQVADGADGLYKNLKIAGSFEHIHHWIKKVYKGI